LILSIALGADALLALGFGVASYVSPESTYATIIDLRGAGADSLLLAILRSLSAFYVVIGALCLCALFMPAPHRARVAAVMLIQHAWIGAKAFQESGREWVVGNPWPDVVIHTLFVLTYAAGLVWSRRRSQVGRSG
jgi:hypothetical protein